MRPRQTKSTPLQETGLSRSILGDYGIKAERKTIYDDIKTLCDSGMDIEITKDGHSNAYYLAQRLFQDEELYVLADAVASSRFLTQKKSKELLKKIQSLTSEHKAKDRSAPNGLCVKQDKDLQ